MCDAIEQFAAAWALKQLVDKAVKTGVSGNLRDQVNDHYRRLYELDGERGHDLMVNGEKVGRYTFAERKGEAARTERTVRAFDYAAILADENEDFRAYCERYLRNHIGELAEQYVRETGDMLDGVSVVDEEVPATPATVAANGTPSGITPQRVADAMGPLLADGMGDVIRGLLGS